MISKSNFEYEEYDILANVHFCVELQIRKSMLVFKENLEAFARKHKLEINQNPQFRRQFSKMCEKIGVDPLASNKGFWAEMLGVGDFYYELSVQIVDVCLSTREHNGGAMMISIYFVYYVLTLVSLGLIGVSDLLHRVQHRRGRNAEAIETDDIRRAIEKVKVLGNGFDLVNVGHQKMVISVPVEFNRDHTALLSIAQVRINCPPPNGRVTHLPTNCTFQTRFLRSILIQCRYF